MNADDKRAVYAKARKTHLEVRASHWRGQNAARPAEAGNTAEENIRGMHERFKRERANDAKIDDEETDG